LSFPRDPAETNEVKATGKLFIENLHWDVSEQDLKTLFEQIGPVAKAYIKVSLSALDEKGVVLIQVALGT
jgi:RNA recognition motif-containing protein